MARAGRRSTDTAQFYRKKSGHLLRVLGRDFRVATLTNSSTVDSYISVRRGEEVHDTTIAKELVCLRAALKLAKRRGLCRICTEPGGQDGTPCTPWNEAIFKILEKNADRDGP
jgi:hypothetical protein